MTVIGAHTDGKFQTNGGVISFPFFPGFFGRLSFWTNLTKEPYHKDNVHEKVDYTKKLFEKVPCVDVKSLVLAHKKKDNVAVKSAIDEYLEILRIFSTNPRPVAPDGTKLSEA